jgi:hypothetical protein
MTLYVCNNCDFRTTDVDKLHEIQDFAQRHTPGDTVADGQCPDCGSLVFQEWTPDTLVIVVSGGNIQSMHANRELAMAIVVIDHDNIEAEAEEIADRADEIEAAALDNCPVSIGWCDHEMYV